VTVYPSPTNHTTIKYQSDRPLAGDDDGKNISALNPSKLKDLTQASEASDQASKQPDQISQSPDQTSQSSDQTSQSLDQTSQSSDQASKQPDQTGQSPDQASQSSDQANQMSQSKGPDGITTVLDTNVMGSDNDITTYHYVTEAIKDQPINDIINRRNNINHWYMHEIVAQFSAGIM